MRRILAPNYIFSKYNYLNVCACAELYRWYLSTDHSQKKMFSLYLLYFPKQTSLIQIKRLFLSPLESLMLTSQGLVQRNWSQTHIRRHRLTQTHTCTHRSHIKLKSLGSNVVFFKFPHTGCLKIDATHLHDNNLLLRQAQWRLFGARPVKMHSLTYKINVFF